MQAEPFGWNVVVAGAWNLAILTPDGIRRRLLELPDGIPIEVEVSIDRPGPIRVVSDGLVIAPLPHALEIGPKRFERADLRKATDIAKKALRALPATPMSAVGVNIRYKFATLPFELIGLLKAPIDDALSDDDFRIEAGVTKRSLSLPPGVINLEISQGQMGDGTVALNFHRDSGLPIELEEWLGRVDEFIELSDRVFRCIRTDVHP